MFKYNTILKPILRPQLKNGKLYREETMVEISEGIYIGSSKDYEYNKNKDDMNFINACKYPYWEEYAKEHSNNGLYAYSGNRLICNLVDADDSKYIPSEIIEECINYIEKSVKEKKKILINCNEGKSRSATIGLIYLIKHKKISDNSDLFYKVLDKYKEIVPRYEPNLGMLSYVSDYYANISKKFTRGN